MHNDSDNDDNTDDAALFREQMQGVKPLSDNNRVSQRKTPKNIRVQNNTEMQSSGDRFADVFIDEHSDVPETLSFSRPGVQRSKLAKLHQGKLHIEDSIDLHGSSVAQARQYLEQFLAECQQQHIAVVRIVHGKGKRSKNKFPVIKAMLNHWLRDAPEVLAFHSAQLKDGGTGALYVLLKR